MKISKNITQPQMSIRTSSELSLFGVCLQVLQSINRESTRTSQRVSETLLDLLRRSFLKRETGSFCNILLCYETFFYTLSTDCNLKHVGIYLSNVCFIFNNKQHKNVKLKQYPKQLTIFMNV